jgi:hypothetical protein
MIASIFHDHPLAQAGEDTIRDETRCKIVRPPAVVVRRRIGFSG